MFAVVGTVLKLRVNVNGKQNIQAPNVTEPITAAIVRKRLETPELITKRSSAIGSRRMTSDGQARGRQPTVLTPPGHQMFLPGPCPLNITPLSSHPGL